MLKQCKIVLLFPTIFSVAFARAYFIDDNIKNTHVEQPAQPKGNLDDIKEFFDAMKKHCQVDPPQESLPNRMDVDNALFLTPYIKTGHIKQGQELATVPSMVENVQSFAGYLTVNETAGSNMFFWLFKSQEGKWEELPLVIWLNGGPGESSLLGLFNEVGPFSVTEDQKLIKREYSWNRKFNLVFLDNPVGTGFSFTKEDFGYARTASDVARDLYEAIVQLYNLFPSLQKNQLFIAGESYAGKYIPAIGYKIHEMNHASSFKVDLGGLLIGNGWTDPINQVGYASLLYELGLIDGQRRDTLALLEDDIKKNIRAGEFKAAADGDSEEFCKATNLMHFGGMYDFVNEDYLGNDFEVRFINDSKTREALHVGSHDFSGFNPWVMGFLHKDRMQSVKPWVEKLLTAQEFPIMYYSGQLDIIVPYSQSVKFYNSLQWPHAEEYRKAKRCQFKVDGDFAGYYKTAGTFTEVLVRNAGHMVPIRQPKWAFELLDRFVTNSSSFKCK